MAPVALITGATGLIGQHVMAQWDLDGLRPVAVSRAESDLLAPGRAAALVTTYRPSVVVHLAWSASGTTGYRSDPANDQWVEASLELAAACRASGAWLLATGTPLDGAEEGDAYSRSKARLRRELAGAIDAYECTWLRPFYVIDPQRRRPALVDQALSAAERDEAIVLATPESAHDFIHARDVGSAVVEVVRRDLRGDVSIGAGRLHRVRDLVEALGVAWTSGTDVTDVPAQHHAAADTSRLREHGWSPVFTKELFHGE